MGLIGYKGETTDSWLVNNDEAMHTIFELTSTEEIDRLYAKIQNSLTWAMSYPVVRAYIVNLDTGQLVAESSEVAMPPYNSAENILKEYEFLLGQTLTLPPAKYAFGLHVGEYGGIYWIYASGSEGQTRKYDDAYADGLTLPFGTPKERLWKKFYIYAVLGGVATSPKARFSWTPSTPMFGKAINFDASLSEKGYDGTNVTEIRSYAWAFGDGTAATGIKVTHVFEKEGEYNVILTVTDSQGLTDSVTQPIMVLGFGAQKTVVTYESDEDFQIGVENAARHVIYSEPNTVFEVAPKIWTYGGWSNIQLQQKLGGGLFDYLGFKPEKYGVVPVPPIEDAGSQCARLELHNPDVSLDDETRRLEIFRIHDPYVLNKEIESWIYLPEDFIPDGWCVLLRATRELVLGQVAGYPENAMLNIGLSVGAGGKIAGTDPAQYYLSVPLNHCSEPTKFGGTRTDLSTSKPVTLGKWFKAKMFVHRDNKYGLIKVWLSRVDH